jgi:hypothetical protein
MDRGASDGLKGSGAASAADSLATKVQQLSITPRGKGDGSAQPPSPPKNKSKSKSPRGIVKKSATNGEAFFEANGSMQQELLARKEALLKKDGTNSVTLSDISEHQVHLLAIMLVAATSSVCTFVISFSHCFSAFYQRAN